MDQQQRDEKLSDIVDSFIFDFTNNVEELSGQDNVVYCKSLIKGYSIIACHLISRLTRLHQRGIIPEHSMETIVMLMNDTFKDILGSDQVQLIFKGSKSEGVKH